MTTTYVSTAEAARIIGVPRETVHRWIRSGRAVPSRSVVTANGKRTTYLWDTSEVAALATMVRPPAQCATWDEACAFVRKDNG